MSPLTSSKRVRLLLLGAAVVALGACATDASVSAPEAPLAAPQRSADELGDEVGDDSTALATSAAAVVQPERANLPRVYVSTTYPATPGRVINVISGMDFQRVLDTAKLGDVIRLQAGITFTGNFVLRKKEGTGWIVIRPTVGDGVGGLPTVGNRVSSAHASVMPKLVSPNVGAALRTEDGAHHYRIVGLEITHHPSLTLNNGLVLLGDGSGAQSTLAEVPHNLVLDRVYVHGTDLVDMKRCVALNSATSAVIDSYLTDCHHRGADAQAIGGWNGPGPYKIHNNRLEGSGEVIMFGGADPSIPNLIPTDIEIGRNYITRPMAWKDVYMVKNLFELKNAQRVRVEGNVFENNWADGQVGFALVWKSVNQDGRCTWCVVQDVTFRYNKVRRTAGVLALSGSAGDYAAALANHFTVETNILEVDESLTPHATSANVQFLGRLSDVLIQHNTFVRTPGLLLSFASGTITRLGFSNNIAFVGPYGIKGTGTGMGNVTLATFAPNAAVAGNIIVGADPKTYPLGNFYPATYVDAGMYGWPLSRYYLDATSIFKRKGTDGLDPGAQYTQVESATSNVAW